MKTLALANFIVHSLTKPHKQQQLIWDVTRYRIDVCAIEETKVQQLSDASSGNHGVIFFETKFPHFFNDFIVYPQLKNNVHKYWYISDRVSVLQVQHRKLSNTKKCAWNIKETSSEFKDSVSLNVQLNGVSYKCLPIPKITIKREIIPDSKHIINIINVHAPTSQLVRDDVSVLQNFYNNISTILNELKNKSLVFSTGDWNAKVGKRSNSMPVTVVLKILLTVFKMIVDNISSISAQSTTFSSATQPCNINLPTKLHGKANEFIQQI